MRSPPQVPDGNTGNGVRLATCGSTVGKLLTSALCTACSMRCPLSSGNNSSQPLPCTRWADRPLWLAIHWFHNTTRPPASSTTRPKLASPSTRPYKCWPAVTATPRQDGRRDRRIRFFACGLSKQDGRPAAAGDHGKIIRIAAPESLASWRDRQGPPPPAPPRRTRQDIDAPWRGRHRAMLFSSKTQRMACSSNSKRNATADAPRRPNTGMAISGYRSATTSRQCPNPWSNELTITDLPLPKQIPEGGALQ